MLVASYILFETSFWWLVIANLDRKSKIISKKNHYEKLLFLMERQCFIRGESLWIPHE